MKADKLKAGLNPSPCIAKYSVQSKSRFKFETPRGNKLEVGIDLHTMLAQDVFVSQLAPIVRKRTFFDLKTGRPNS